MVGGGLLQDFQVLVPPPRSVGVKPEACAVHQCRTAPGLVLGCWDVRGVPGCPGCSHPAPCPQIASLLKDHERIQAGQTSAPSDDDSDIKKIKKVGGEGSPSSGGPGRRRSLGRGELSEEEPPLTGFREENGFCEAGNPSAGGVCCTGHALTPDPGKPLLPTPGRGRGAEPHRHGARTDRGVLQTLFDAREGWELCQVSSHTSAGGVPRHLLAPEVGGCTGRFGGAGLSTGIPHTHVVLLAPHPQPGRSGANTGFLLLIGVFMCLCKRGKRTQSAMRTGRNHQNALFPAGGSEQPQCWGLLPAELGEGCQPGT